MLFILSPLLGLSVNSGAYDYTDVACQTLIPLGSQNRGMAVGGKAVLRHWLKQIR